MVTLQLPETVSAAPVLWMSTLLSVSCWLPEQVRGVPTVPWTMSL